jgi:hypothetical protein
MVNYERKTEAQKVLKLDSEKAEGKSYSEKETRRAVVNTRADTALIAASLTIMNKQLRWVRILLVLILLVLVFLAIP